MAISGLISDGRVLAQYMRNECLNHRYVYGTGMQTERLVIKVSDKSQVFTQKAEKRPYGVGLLVSGVDRTGPHLYQTEPSGVYFDCIAQAIGSRAQSAKTYLEKIYESLDGLSRDELIEHVLRALKGSSTKKLTSRNVAIGVVGINTPFTIIEGDELRPFVHHVTNEDDEDEDDEKKKKTTAATTHTEQEEKASDAEEEKEARESQEQQRREEAQMED